MVKALCVGSFDPITMGHIGVLKYAMGLFDSVGIAIAVNSSKKGLFSVPERADLAKEALESMNIACEVRVFGGGLTATNARGLGYSVLLRGLRAGGEFEEEFKQAILNNDLGIRTLFVPADNEFHFVSSSAVRTLAGLGAPVDKYVPKSVAYALRRRMAMTVPA